MASKNFLRDPVTGNTLNRNNYGRTVKGFPTIKPRSLFPALTQSRRSTRGNAKWPVIVGATPVIVVTPNPGAAINFEAEAETVPIRDYPRRRWFRSRNTDHTGNRTSKPCVNAAQRDAAGISMFVEPLTRRSHPNLAWPTRC